MTPRCWNSAASRLELALTEMGEDCQKRKHGRRSSASWVDRIKSELSLSHPMGESGRQCDIWNEDVNWTVISVRIKFFLILIRTETREERPKWKTEIFKSLIARISAGSSPGHVTNNLNGAQLSSLSLALPWSGLAFLSAIL